jgi:acyl carrier protein
MTPEPAAVETQIRAFVTDTLAVPKGVASISRDEHLVDNGVLDSLGIFQLVAFLEETFRIRVGDEEITPDNFASLTTITDFVGRKLQLQR